jgi:hypothetical protein
MHLCKLCGCGEDNYICDFCLFYNFNGRKKLFRGKYVQAYTGEGYCLRTGERREPGNEACNDFYCELIPKYGMKKVFRRGEKMPQAQFKGLARSACMGL